VPLAPGERRTVRFGIPPARLAFYDAGMRFVTEPGRFTAMVGASAADVRAEASVTLGGEVAVYRQSGIPPTAVRVE